MTEYDPTASEEFDIDANFEGELSLEELAALDVAALDSSSLPQLEMDASELEEPDELQDVEPPPEEIASEAPEAAVDEAHAFPFPFPRPIIRQRYGLVSGRYASQRSVWRLTLRIDLDGRRPLRKISGDFHRVSGATTRYFGSFVVDRPRIRASSTRVSIIGRGRFSWSTSYSTVRIDIPRVPYFSRPANAQLVFLAGTRRGTSYSCRFISRYFRTVVLEQDSEVGVQTFQSYNTGSLGSGGPARTLSVARAFGEAGIQVIESRGRNRVNVAPGGTWSNAELHNAMVTQFSLWKNEPQWKLWLLHARKHELGRGLLGIMFDQRGAQRQGAAVFYAGIGGSAAADQREQLYTCVHELGHAFNLFHSFHKSSMTPPLPNRPSSRSYMNYPPRFPGGSSAFWAAFPFQFDTLETTHLRHAFLRNIVPGANPFGRGAALEEEFENATEDRSGLELRLRLDRKSVALGEPVRVEIRLASTGATHQGIHCELDPRASLVQIGIQKPSGEVVAHEPMIEHCVKPGEGVLEPDAPIYESAYIGYGKNGLAFASPGQYRIRAIYHALDGSQVLSNTLEIRVRSPLDRDEEEIADLLLGEEQGQLFELDGSDCIDLKSGNQALEEVVTKYAKHPLALQAMRPRGLNALRSFKAVMGEGELKERGPELDRAESILATALAGSGGGVGLDNIGTSKVGLELIRAQRDAGQKEQAEGTARSMLASLSKLIAKKSVLDNLTARVELAQKGSRDTEE